MMTKQPVLGAAGRVGRKGIQSHSEYFCCIGDQLLHAINFEAVHPQGWTHSQSREEWQVKWEGQGVWHKTMAGVAGIKARAGRSGW